MKVSVYIGAVIEVPDQTMTVERHRAALKADLMERVGNEMGAGTLKIREFNWYAETGATELERCGRVMVGYGGEGSHLPTCRLPEGHEGRCSTEN